MSLECPDVPESNRGLKTNLVGPCQRDRRANIERSLNGKNWNNRITSVVSDYNLKHKINMQESILIEYIID